MVRRLVCLVPLAFAELHALFDLLADLEGGITCFACM
jgi:hypothetical protein